MKVIPWIVVSFVRAPVSILIKKPGGRWRGVCAVGKGDRSGSVTGMIEELGVRAEGMGICEQCMRFVDQGGRRRCWLCVWRSEVKEMVFCVLSSV